MSRPIESDIPWEDVYSEIRPYGLTWLTPRDNEQLYDIVAHIKRQQRVKGYADEYIASQLAGFDRMCYVVNQLANGLWYPTLFNLTTGEKSFNYTEYGGLSTIYYRGHYIEIPTVRPPVLGKGWLAGHYSIDDLIVLNLPGEEIPSRFEASMKRLKVHVPLDETGQKDWQGLPTNQATHAFKYEIDPYNQRFQGVYSYWEDDSRPGSMRIMDNWALIIMTAEDDIDQASGVNYQRIKFDISHRTGQDEVKFYFNRYGQIETMIIPNPGYKNTGTNSQETALVAAKNNTGIRLMPNITINTALSLRALIQNLEAKNPVHPFRVLVPVGQGRLQ